MQFEAGAQPDRAPFSPFTDMDPERPNPAVQSWFRYGVNEGIPRLLDLFERKGIAVTSHMVGRAVELRPDLAREIVDRGHEAAAHGQEWRPHWRMEPEEEHASYAANIAAIEAATGVRPTGFNAFALRNGPNTLDILAALGIRYYIDDISRDEPSIISAGGRDFGVVPYTRRNNDIERFHRYSLSAQDFLTDLKDEFDVLYAEGGRRRRMMSVSTHDRIGGTPAISKAVGEFIDYAQGHAGVAFMRKDAIADWVLSQTDTPRN
jgi:peptidoglycan/xylan/chitin deacetylase (PgdA/CDA1 family)